MTPTETAAKLRVFNDWRRGGDIDQPGPLAVGEAIDAAVEMIEAMERQEPIGWFARIDGDGPLMECKHADIPSVPLYALPGAQPAPSVPDGWKLVPIEPTPMMKTAGIGVEVYQDSPPSSDCLTWEEVEAIYTAMLAAAPEAKP